jgi:uncharacterized delta-60 repeat protein
MKTYLFAFSLVLFSPTIISAQIGALDPTFGANGVATIGFGSNGPSTAWAAEVAPDGKMLFGGRISDASQAYPFVTRYWPDGRLDSLFGDNGRLIYRKFQPERIKTLSNGKILLLGASQVARLNADGSEDEGFSGVFPAGAQASSRLALLPDGRFLVALSGNTAPFNQGCVARYSADFLLDTTFGQNGLAYLGAPGAGFANDIALGPDGKVVVVGLNGQNRRMLARYLPDGSPDPGFGANGTLVWGDTIDGYFADADRVLLQADGKILVAGLFSTFDTLEQIWTTQMVGLYRFEAEGLTDAGFGNAGLATPYWADRFFDVFLQNNNKIQIVGGDWSGECLFQVLPDGSLDPDFQIRYLTGNNAYQQGELALAQQPDGKLAVATSPRFQVPMASYPPRMAVSRRLADGNLDAGFGTDGYVYNTTPNVGSGYANGMVVQPDGKLLLWGTSSAFVLDYNLYSWFTYPFVMRFNADGSRDLDWYISPSDLFLNYSPNNTYMRFYAVSPLLDGKTLLAYDHNGLKIARFKTNSMVDSTFGANGRLALPNGYSEVLGMTVQPDGKILVAASAQGGGVSVFRFLANGSGADASFGISGGINLGNISPWAGFSLTPEGKIVLASQTGQVVRLTANGALDPTFNGDGVATLSLAVRAVVVQSDGKILLCGDAGLVARVVADGNGLDSGFGNQGMVTFPLAAQFKSIVCQPDGKIVATGSADQSLVAARWLANGQADASFGANGLTSASFAPYSAWPLAVVLQPSGKIIVAANGNALNGSRVHLLRFLSGLTVGTSEQVFPRAARMASPNPFSEFLRLDFSTLPAVPSEVAVFDLNGRRVFVAHEISAQSTDIQEVASWQPGVYLLRATTPRGTFVQKIVKQ